MEEKRICPECGKEYSSRPALSRKDNKTMICPKCGMMEALDTVRDFYAPRMTDQHMMRFVQRIEPEHWCTGQAGQKRMRKQNCS